jgi:hypothetical protein
MAGARMIGPMTDKPDDSTDFIPGSEPPVSQHPAAAAPNYGPPASAPVIQKPSRLNQVAAWVGIAAGAVVIVAVVFATGFMLGAHSGRDGGGRGSGHDRGAMDQRDGPPMWGPGPMMRPGPAFVFPGGPGFPQFPGFPGGQAGPGGSGGSGQGPAATPPTPGR